MTLDDAGERSAAAGEYVLGTSSREAREVFEGEMQRAPALRADVYFWQDRLLGLAARVAPVEPSRTLWPAIEQALARPAPKRRAVPDSANASAANDPVWQRLRRWQWIGGCALAASAVLASVLGLKALAPPAELPARYLAVLQAPDDRSTGWIVEVTRGDRVRLIPVGPMAPVPAGKALQFWTKPEGAAGPTSLGLVDAGRTTELPAARLPAVGEKQLFELTLEAQGGSAIGRPTGPVLFVGRTVRLSCRESEVGPGCAATRPALRLKATLNKSLAGRRPRGDLFSVALRFDEPQFDQAARGVHDAALLRPRGPAEQRLRVRGILVAHGAQLAHHGPGQRVEEGGHAHQPVGHVAGGDLVRLRAELGAQHVGDLAQFHETP